MNEQVKLIGQIMTICQVLNYKLDELQPCIFKGQTKVLIKNLQAQSEKVDSIVNSMTTKIDNHGCYLRVVEQIDKIFEDEI